MRALVDGAEVWVGRPQELERSPELARGARALGVERAARPIVIERDARIVGAIALADTVKPEARRRSRACAGWGSTSSC